MFYSAAKYTGAELRFSGWCFSVIKMITDTIESSHPLLLPPLLHPLSRFWNIQ